MSFLSPLFLAGAAAAAIPIVLHLLKRRPEARVKLATVMLLQHAPVEHAQKRRLRELLLLALRVTAVALLAIAFARPFFVTGAAGSSDVTVVAIDTSFSMSAPGQFEKARQLAKQAIDNHAGGLQAVMTFADSARVISEPSGDRASAKAAIDASTAGAGATSYLAALNAAATLLKGRAGTIVMITDLQGSGWDAGTRAAIPGSARLEIVDVGQAPSNLAVTSLRSIGTTVVATVRNTGSQSRQAHVTLNVSDSADVNVTRREGETSVSIEPGQSADVSFASPRGRWASAVVDDREGAAADNARYLVLDTSTDAKVLLVSAAGDPGHEGFYVEQALLAAGSDGRAYGVENVAGADLQSWDQARFDAHRAVILLSTRGLDHRGRSLLGEYLRTGGGLLVAAGSDVDGDVLAELFTGLDVSTVPPAADGGGRGLPTRTLAPLDARHPVFQAFAGRSSLGLVKFQRITTMRARGCQILARFTTGEAAIVDCEPGEGRALLFASDLDNKGNDFPLHATFLPFVREAMRYLSRTRQTADYLVADAPSGTPAVPGVTELAGTGGASRLVAVNVDPKESDPARLTAEQFQAAVTRLNDAPASEPQLEARQQEDRQEMWRYALAFVMMTLAVEGIVATRAI